MIKELYNILKQEVKPALGCTGPIAVCYCAAEAYDAIGGEIIDIEAIMDWGIGSKIDDVAFPGSQMLGVEMAVALGAVCGDPQAGMEVLHAVTLEGELKARKVAELVTVKPQWDLQNLEIYCDITIRTDKGEGRAVISQRSDGLILKTRNGEVLFEQEADLTSQSGELPILKYKIQDFYKFVLELTEGQLEFLKKVVQYNTKLAEATLKDRLGAGIGYELANTPYSTPITRAKAYAAAGCEARMSGVNSPAMTCANKGNVGIAASMPLVSLSRDLNISEVTLLRGIAMSYLTAIAVIHRIGKTPSMCSCEVAAMLGVTAGSVLMQGGNYEKIEAAMQNAIPNVFGVVCDGAKLACALRISSGTGIALECADLALRGVRIANGQGVLGYTIDESIDILGHTALYGMIDSDRQLCRQLFSKRKIFPLMTFEERQKQ